MNTETQAEALRLADQLDKVPEHGADPDLIERSSAELRRLHAENLQLRADLEAIGAGGVGPLMKQRKFVDTELTDEVMSLCPYKKSDRKLRDAWLFGWDLAYENMKIGGKS